MTAQEAFDDAAKAITAFAEAAALMIERSIANLGHRFGSPVVTYSWTDERRSTVLRLVLADGRVVYGRGGGKLEAIAAAMSEEEPS